MKASKKLPFIIIILGIISFGLGILLRAGFTRAGVTDIEKVIAVSNLWSSAKDFYAYWNDVPELDWDKEYETALTEAVGAKDNYAFYLALERFGAKLQDGHFTVLNNRQQGLDVGIGQLPFTVCYVDGHYFVETKRMSELEVVERSEIMSIDGIETQKYLEDHMGPLVGSKPNMPERIS